jgi:sulfonate transport system permease protein
MTLIKTMFTRWFGSVLVAAAFVGLWQLVANAEIVAPAFLPSPVAAWNALVSGFQSGVLTEKLAGTVHRMIVGWLLASLLGIALGALIGISTTTKAYLAPALELLRPLPSSAVIPLAITFLGLSDRMVLAVVGFGALWPMLLATIHGFSVVEPRLYEVGRCLRLSRLALIFKVALPSALPDILAGMRIGIAIALILTVVGEMLASRDGLGQWVLLAGRSYRSADLFAGVILLGALGFVSASLLSVIEKRLLRWRVSH